MPQLRAYPDRPDRSPQRSCAIQSELERRLRHAADAEQARTHVRADHRADLGGEDGVAAVDRLANLDQPLGVLWILDVLDHPRVGAVRVSLTRVVDHSLEGSLPCPDALDRGDLVLQGEDRLDLQGRADPGSGRADPPATAQIVEG